MTSVVADDILSVQGSPKQDKIHVGWQTVISSTSESSALAVSTVTGMLAIESRPSRQKIVQVIDARAVAKIILLVPLYLIVTKFSSIWVSYWKLWCSHVAQNRMRLERSLADHPNWLTRMRKLMRFTNSVKAKGPQIRTHIKHKWKHWERLEQDFRYKVRIVDLQNECKDEFSGMFSDFY